MVMTVGGRVYVAYNEDGRRVGETHHNARIPDAVVDKIRERYEDEGASCTQLSRELSLSVKTIHKIVYYERRVQTAVRWKALPYA
jgi:hypothetical protein